MIPSPGRPSNHTIGHKYVNTLVGGSPSKRLVDRQTRYRVSTRLCPTVSAVEEVVDGRAGGQCRVVGDAVDVYLNAPDGRADADRVADDAALAARAAVDDLLDG